jgi:hypothetical protein
LNEPQQLLVCAADVNLLDENKNIIKKNTCAVLDFRKEVGLEVNLEKTAYVLVSSLDCRQNRYIKAPNTSFENVAQLKYLGRKLTDRNSVHNEIKSRLNSGLAYYLAGQNLLSSGLLYKKVEIKTKLILPIVCGLETSSVTLREQCGSRVFENGVMLRGIFGPKMDKARGGRQDCIMRSSIICALRRT